MPTTECLEALITRYPDHAAWIARMHELDPTFREICHDHYEVVVSLSKLDRRRRGIEREVEDCEVLLGQLDGEIAKFLDG